MFPELFNLCGNHQQTQEGTAVTLLVKTFQFSNIATTGENIGSTQDMEGIVEGTRKNKSAPELLQPTCIGTVLDSEGKLAGPAESVSIEQV